MVESDVLFAHILSQTKQNVQLLMDYEVLTEESGLAILSKLQVVPTTRKNSDNPIVHSLTKQTQRLSISPPGGVGSAPHKVEARVNWEWISEDPKNLLLRAGDIIEIIAETNADWWMGRNRSGKEGLFPSNYVEKLLPRELSPISVTGSSISRTSVSSPKGVSGFADHRYSSSVHSLSHPSPAPPQQQYPAPSALPHQAQYPPPPGASRYYPPPQNAVNYSHVPPSHAPPAAIRQQLPSPAHMSQYERLGKSVGAVMVQSAASGVGFGAGAAVGGGLINSIF